MIKAAEQLQVAPEEWSQKRIEPLDWINEEFRRQNHAVQTFRDGDAAMHEYNRVTGKPLDLPEPEPFCQISTHRVIAKKIVNYLHNPRDGRNRSSRLQAHQVIQTDRARLHKSSLQHGSRDLSIEPPFKFFFLFSFCSSDMHRMGFPEELYFPLLEVAHCARHRKISGLLAAKMIDIALNL